MRLINVLFIMCFGVGVCDIPSIPKIGNGYRVHEKASPWHAGLYKKTTKPYEQICGGTVIARHVVITAAHCISMDKLIRPPVSQFAVAAGKIYRPWNNTHDTGAQKSDVKEIKIPPRYQGSVANFQDDIALLILTNEFVFSDYVKPACLNFNPEFDEFQLRERQLGMVVGWGLTNENSNLSQVLQAATLPCINIDKCIEQSPVSFRSSITGDKICAGYNNGTAVCRGDSGGGLVFHTVLNSRWVVFLRGVVSTSPATENMCNIHTWATFTHLLRHEHFVTSVVPDVEEDCKIPSDDKIKVRGQGGSDQHSSNNRCPCL